ncbi:MAG: transposase [Peptococcaceae bacterium]|nr:transposase [Peptococcaceae bacterium]
MGQAKKTKQRVFAKDFKIQVVGEYLAGEVGATTIGRKYGIDDAVITRWINAYKLKGEAAFDTKKGPPPGRPQPARKPKSDDKDELIRYLRAENDILKKIDELQRRDAPK